MCVPSAIWLPPAKGLQSSRAYSLAVGKKLRRIGGALAETYLVTVAPRLRNFLPTLVVLS